MAAPPSHVLIIGCGYVGHRLARYWRAHDVRVTALTRSPDRARGFERDGIHPCLGDVLQPETLANLPPADLCVHAVGYDRHSPHGKRDVYVDGLNNVLTVIHDRIPRLIYVSSSSVYGQDAGETVTESSPCEPIKEGGRICLAAEQLIHEFFPGTSSSRIATILRLAGIYGPGRLIGRIDQLRQGRVISGRPDAWLNLIHVDDVVAALAQLATHPAASATYLLSDEFPVQRQAFYEALAELADAPPPAFAEDSLSLNKRCNSSLIRTELGLRLQYPTYKQGLPHAFRSAQ